MKTTLLPLLATSLLAACASLDATDPASRHYQIPASSTVVVEQEIAIPPGSAHAILQGGKTVGVDTLRRYEPFCEIEVNDVRDHQQTIRPGRFALSRVVRQQLMGAAEAPPLLLAGNSHGDYRLAGVGIGIGIGGGSGGFGFGLGIGTRIGLDGEGGSTLVLNAVHLRLKSAEQPNVRELRCTAGWAEVASAVYPTLAEMRGALGGLVSLEIQ